MASYNPYTKALHSMLLEEEKSMPVTLAQSHREKTPGIPHWFSIWEALGLIMALGVGFHFLALRIHAGALPGGDEGSWLSVAAEVSRGHGYTTRWLEAHFLLPYTLPRPDDFRYPALTTLLGLVFQFTGISVEAGRWTVAVLFLVFCSLTYFVCRFALGRWAAMAGLWMMVVSLLQLEWNSQVFTEGLFGLTLALLLAWSLWGEASLEKNHPFGFQSLTWWILLGCGVGFLYFVRANGILFLPGIVWLYWRRRYAGVNWRHPLLAIAAFTLMVSPWLIRSELLFGNPFHIAGSAGMLREVGQSHTQSMSEYFSQHELLFPLKRVVLGCARFFQVLHEREHGLEFIPLLLFLIALLFKRRVLRPFFSPFVVLGFAFTFFASAYVAADSWAGIRYMSALLPFIYACGLSVIPTLVTALWRKKSFSEKEIQRIDNLSKIGRPLLGGIAIALLLLPVFYPHRFYERQLTQKIEESGAYAYRKELPNHLRTLKVHLTPDSHYYAASLCNLNFLSDDLGLELDLNCVGLQELYDPTWFARSIAAFNPKLIALTHLELKNETLLRALAQMRSAGYRQDTVGISPLAVYLSLNRL